MSWFWKKKFNIKAKCIFYNNIITIKNIELKSRIIFDTSHIEKLEIKDFVKTLNFLGPHISLIKINLNLFSSNISSIIKLLIHYNIIIIDYFDNTKINIISEVCNSHNKNYKDYAINLINIEQLLKPYNFEMDYIVIDDIKIKEFYKIRLNIFNNIKHNKNILGIITKQQEYIFEKILKIDDYDHNESLEKKILLLNYKLLITNNVKNLINLKNLINNIIT